MSIEVDELAALHRAYEMARDRYGKTIYSHNGQLRIEVALHFAPNPGEPFAVLDAWADYAIAKARYERALVMARRGVEL